MKYLENNVLFVLMIAAAFLLGGITSTILLSSSGSGTLEPMGIGTGAEATVDLDKSPWDKVEVGMSESEVKSIMGEPLSVHEQADQEKRTLNYKISGSNDSEHVDYYVVIQDGKVVEKKR
jgi:outer membrane protein assembly factor BamE (lipoprotein component of BamABCDE complex)